MLLLFAMALTRWHPAIHPTPWPQDTTTRWPVDTPTPPRWT